MPLLTDIPDEPLTPKTATVDLYTRDGVRETLDRLAKYPDFPFYMVKEVPELLEAVKYLHNAISNLYSGERFSDYKEDVVDHLKSKTRPKVISGTVASFLYWTLPTKTPISDEVVEVEQKQVEMKKEPAQTWMYDEKRKTLIKHSESKSTHANIYMMSGKLSLRHSKILCKEGVVTATTYGKDGLIIQEKVKVKNFDAVSDTVKRGWGLGVMLVLTFVIVIIAIILIIVLCVRKYKGSSKKKVSFSDDVEVKKISVRKETVTL